MLAVLHAQCPQGGVKDACTGLLAAQLLGDEHILHEVGHAALGQPPGLHLVDAVAHHGQCGHLRQLPQHVQHLGVHQVRVGRQLLQIIAVHLCAVSGGVNGFEEAAEPLVEQLFAADLAFFQLTPQFLIDGAVGLHCFGVRLDAVVHQRFGQCLALGGVKVEQRIVRIKQDAIVFCHNIPSFPFPARFAGRALQQGEASPAVGRAGFCSFRNHFIRLYVGLFRFVF